MSWNTQVCQQLQDTSAHAGRASEQDDGLWASWDVLITRCFSKWVELVGSGLVTSEELDDLDVVEQGFLIVDDDQIQEDCISEQDNESDDTHL